MVDLDLLSCFSKNWQESLERSGGIKLSKCATMEEREQEKLVETMGKKAPFIWGHKIWSLGLKKLTAPTARPRAGLGPAWLGRNPKRPALARPEPGLGWPNCRKISNTKTNIF